MKELPSVESRESPGIRYLLDRLTVTSYANQADDLHCLIEECLHHVDVSDTKDANLYLAYAIKRYLQTPITIKQCSKWKARGKESFESEDLMTSIKFTDGKITDDTRSIDKRRKSTILPQLVQKNAVHVRLLMKVRRISYAAFRYILSLSSTSTLERADVNMRCQQTPTCNLIISQTMQSHTHSFSDYEIAPHLYMWLHKEDGYQVTRDFPQCTFIERIFPYVKGYILKKINCGILGQDHWTVKWAIQHDELLYPFIYGRWSKPEFGECPTYFCRNEDELEATGKKYLQEWNNGQLSSVSLLNLKCAWPSPEIGALCSDSERKGILDKYVPLNASKYVSL